MPTPVAAKEPPAQLEQSELRNLARDFVSKIGGKLKNYDAAQGTKDQPKDQLSLIEDGELLLLRPKTGKLILNAEIGTIKERGTLYYSLEDLISQLELAIDYKPDLKTGSGWFLREDWLIRLDFVKGEVVSKGTEYKVAPEDIKDDNGDIYISAAAAQKWLEIKTDPEISLQYVEITTPFPYPALARNYRDRNAPSSSTRNTPVLPRLEQEQKWLDLNTAEIQQNVRVRKSKDGESAVTSQNITSVEGEALKHNAYGVAIYDNEEKLSSIRARLTKNSEDPVLLGGLKARSYTIGDTDVTALPLTGNSSQELGFRVNNNPLRNADFQETNINGDSLPGWDVELYRDGFLIDRVRVGDDARYEFPQIELFAGDNLFEVFFYGPLGEIRRDAFNIPVNEEFLNTQNNTYDVSLSFNEAQTYSKLGSDDQDADTPHLVARYNKVIGNTLTYAGVRARQVDGEQKGYLGTGFTNIWNGFVFDGNAALDEQAAAASEIGVRKNIDNWRLSLRGNLQDEAYITDGELDSLWGVLGTATRNFQLPYNSYGSFTTTGEYRERKDNSTVAATTVGYSHQMGRLNLSDSIRYEQVSNLGESADPDARINNAFTGRYSWRQFFARAGINYQISPESEVDNYFSQFTYQPSNKFSSDLLLEHTPRSNQTEARLNLNYKHENFRISPFLEVDNESNMATGMRLSTSLIDDPSKDLPTFTSDRVIGRGMVSSFVYHDKNGNFIYDGDDEPLPKVIVQSVNVARKVPTDERGYSLIKDLPENFVTDIQIDKITLPDPFMIPGFDGVSIFPRAGQIAEITFPVHVAGEVDGTVTLQDHSEKLGLGGVTLDLIPVDGKSVKPITVTAAGDGFYIASNVPPGNYLLGVNAASAARYRAGGQPPVPIRIGYDGTVLSGQDFNLQKDRVQVPVIIESYKGPDYKTPFFAMQTGGAKQSKLSELLSGLMEKKTNIRAKDGLVPIAMEDKQDLNVLPGKDWAAHYARCQELNDAHIPCKVILFIPQKDKKSTKTAGK